MKYVIELNFKSGVHFGADNAGFGVENVQGFAHSDTIFSALVNALASARHAFGSLKWVDPFLVEQEIDVSPSVPFRVSSFGFVDTGSGEHRYYIPRPLLFPSNLADSAKAYGRKKRFNARKYISIDTFWAWQKNEPLDMEEIIHREQDSFWTLEAKVQHVTDSLTLAAQIYRSGLVFYNKYINPFFIVDIPDEDEFPWPEFLKLMDVLKYFGLGGRRSSGCGLFDFSASDWFCIDAKTSAEHRQINPAFLEVKVTPAAILREIFSFQSNCHYLFSTYFPQNTNSLDYVSYNLVQRKGWFFSTSSYRQLKRKTCFMFSEGSVFRQLPPGEIVDVTPEDFDEHRIYRCGRPFTIPFCLETKTVKLKTMSPLHIKGKDVEYGQGFVRRDETSAYAIDSDKLGNYLYQFGGDFTLLTKYVDEIETFARQGKMKKYDFEKFLSDAGIYHHAKNRARVAELCQAGVFRAVVNAVQENHFVRNGQDRPFIPGSAIKGALRTAVMYHLVGQALAGHGQNLPKAFIEGISAKIDEYEKEVARARSDRKKNQLKETFSGELQHWIFQNREPKMRTFLDFFRCVKIKDAPIRNSLKPHTVAVTLTRDKSTASGATAMGVIVSMGEGVEVLCNGEKLEFAAKAYSTHLALLKSSVGKKIKILESGGNKIKKFEITEQTGEEEYIVDFKLDDDGKVVGADTVLETFVGETEVEVILDTFLLNTYFIEAKKFKIPFANIGELFALAASFSAQVWQFEKKFFDSCTDDRIEVSQVRRFYEEQDKPDKLRLGWGTGFPGMTMFLHLKQKDRREFRDRLFEPRPDSPAPRSRRLILEDDNVTQPLGWLQFFV